MAGRQGTRQGDWSRKLRDHILSHNHNGERDCHTVLHPCHMLLHPSFDMDIKITKPGPILTNAHTNEKANLEPLNQKQYTSLNGHKLPSRESRNLMAVINCVPSLIFPVYPVSPFTGISQVNLQNRFCSVVILSVSCCLVFKMPLYLSLLL